MLSSNAKKKILIEKNRTQNTPIAKERKKHSIKEYNVSIYTAIKKRKKINELHVPSDAP